MSFKELRKKKWFKIASNKYVLLLGLFAVWMIFFDSNSLLVHLGLNEKIEQLKENKKFYKKQIRHDTSVINSLNNPEELERFAREQYHMKRKNEDIYIIKYADSLKSK